MTVWEPLLKPYPLRVRLSHLPPHPTPRPSFQALVVYFDIEFSHCHNPIRFSTGPHARYTHWKQTVFYLAEPLTMEKDERITGTLRCRPNSKNHRDLDIEIAYKLAGAISNVDVVQPYRLR